MRINVLTSSRYATAPEIESFYRRPPHGYSADRASEVTRSYMQQGNSGGHIFCYDGHVRKFVSIRLTERGVLVPGFRLKSLLLPQLSKQDEIALSLSQNSANEFCVPLSFLTTLLRCHDYDQAANAIRPQRKQKILSATEVGRAMVTRAASKVVDKKAIAKMAETRRQILGITRKLPPCVIEYFRELTAQDSDGLQAAFTIANLKAVPKNIQPQESLSLVKRMVKYYENSLPVPKPLQARDITDQLVNVRRALGEVEKFNTLCDYECVPTELQTLVDRILTTQILDDDLADNSLKEKLFKPLADGCRNLVTGGTQHLGIATRKLTEIEDNLASKCDLPDGDNQEAGFNASVHGSNGKRAYSRDKTSAMEEEDGTDCKEHEPDHQQEGLVNEEQRSECEKPDRDQNEEQRNPDSNISEVPATDCDQTVDDIAKRCLPIGWHLVQSSFDNFAKQDERWQSVQGKTDLVITELPREENNDKWIKQLVQHVGLAMKLTGVCHMFCTFLQFGKVFGAVGQEGMEMMHYPILYLEDGAKTKKRTLNQRPQESSRCAAVFWRSPDKGTKHHYSSSRKYPKSSMPAWTNVVTNVELSSERLMTLDGTGVLVQVFSKELMRFVLDQWCSPAGLCYNPRSGAMSVGLACHDLGIQYIALEEDDDMYDSASRHIMQTIESPPQPRKRSRVNAPRENTVCGVGERLCLYPGQKATYTCKGEGCEQEMHDLCDWAKVVKGMKLEEREGISVCSKECHENEKM